MQGARPHARELVDDRLGRQLAAIARQADDLGPAGEEFRRAAFVGGDMRLVMAEHRPPGLDQARQRERVRRRAGRDQENRDLALEQLREQGLDPLRPRIVAIGGGEALIGGRHRLHHRRARPGQIVADEIHGRLMSGGLLRECDG